LRAPCSVDKTGENNAAWAKATSSAGVADERAVAHSDESGRAGSRDGTVVASQATRDGGTKLRCHRPLAGVRVRVRRSWS
jgi:hypothetical protein